MAVIYNCIEHNNIIEFTCLFLKRMVKNGVKEKLFR